MSKEKIKDLDYFINTTDSLLQTAKKKIEDHIPTTSPYARENVHEFYHDLQKFKEMNPQEYKKNQKKFNQVLKASEFVVSSTLDTYFSKKEELIKMSPFQLIKEIYKLRKEFQDAQKNIEKLLKKEPKKVAKAIYESSKNDLVKDEDASKELMETMLGLSPALTYKAALITERLDELKARDEKGEKKTKQPKTFKQKLQSFCKAIGRLITRKHIVKDEDLRKALEDFEKLKGLKKKYNAANIETSDKSKKIYGRFTEGLVSSSSKSKPGHSKGNSLFGS